MTCSKRYKYKYKKSEFVANFTFLRLKATIWPFKALFAQIRMADTDVGATIFNTILVL